jgi:hypothetical protein
LPIRSPKAGLKKEIKSLGLMIRNLLIDQFTDELKQKKPAQLTVIRGNQK